MDNDSTMKLSHVVVPLFVAGHAFAQAPGEPQEVAAPGASEAPAAAPASEAPPVDVAPPGMAPVVAPPPAQQPPPPPPREQRWSVSLGLGSLTLAPHNAPDERTQFGLGMLAVRWRPFRHLELELALAGGNESSKDDMGDGGRDVSEALLGLRWRFNPHKKWNLWLMAGVGSISIAPQGATQEQRDALHQSTLQFGGGLERKWRHFAIAAELRAVGVAPIENKDETPPLMGTIGGAPATTTTTDTTTADGWSGAQLLISGNYYF